MILLLLINQLHFSLINLVYEKKNPTKALGWVPQHGGRQFALVIHRIHWQSHYSS